MRRILRIEDALIRWESRIVVVLLLLTLGLAAYNVVYRNVLVPIQRHFATSGPVIAASEPAPAAEPSEPAPSSPDEDTDAGGFGGLEAAEPEDTGAGGFGGLEAAGPEGDTGAGGFGGLEAAEPEDTGAGGFGGLEAADETGEADTGAGGFGGLASAPSVVEDDVPQVPTQPEPLRGPPPPGSFAAWVVDIVDAVKLEWVDILLRQLVILISFLGAMLATRRRKHINIEALGKVLPERWRRIVQVGVNALAVAICVLLAVAGWRLVQLGLEFPKDLVPWAREWTFQLMFPAGFGLLAVHFGVRLGEAIAALGEAEADAAKAGEGGT